MSRPAVSHAAKDREIEMAKVVVFGVRDTAELAHFYLTHDESHTSGSIYQNVDLDQIVTFQTAKVDSAGTCTHYKVGSTWYSFTDPMQMMTGSYYFQFSSPTTPSVQYIAIAAGINNIP